MFRSIVSTSIITAMLFSTFSFASDSDVLDKLKISENMMTQDEVKQIENLYKKYQLLYLKKSCPLQPKAFGNIYTRLKNVESILNSSCLDSDKKTLDLILDGAKDVQDQIDQIKLSQDPTGVATDSLTGAQVNQEYFKQVQNVFYGIGSFFANDDCESSLENRSLLGFLSDVVRGVTQIGMLMPTSNGLTIAAVGGALTSVLDVIEQIFTPRFKFEEPEDREIFVKINCAFYDIRQELDLLGVGSVATEENEVDYTLMNQLSETLVSKQKALNKIKADLVKQIEVAEKKLTVNNQGILTSRRVKVKEMLERLNDLEKRIGEFKSNVKMATDVMSGLRALREIDLFDLVGMRQLALSSFGGHGLTPYRGFEDLNTAISKMASRNEIRIMIIENPGKGISTINNQVIVPLLVEFDYMLEGVEEARELYTKQWNEDNDYQERWMKEAKLENGILVKTIKKKVFPKIDEISNQLQIQINKLKTTNPKLSVLMDNYTSDFKSGNEGVSELRNIVQKNNELSSVIFGKYGHDFLENSRESSLEHFKIFNTNMKKLVSYDKEVKKEAGSGFLELYTTDITEYHVINPEDIAEESLDTVCTGFDILIKELENAKMSAEEGFDFLATNNDLFHGFNKNSVLKDFATTTTGVIKKNIGENDFNNIIRQYRGAVVANRYYDLLASGAEIPEDLKTRFEHYALDGYKDDLARLMYFSYELRDEKRMLQEAMVSLECEKVKQLNTN